MENAVTEPMASCHRASELPDNLMLETTDNYLPCNRDCSSTI